MANDSIKFKLSAVDRYSKAMHGFLSEMDKVGARVRDLNGEYRGHKLQIKNVEAAQSGLRREVKNQEQAIRKLLYEYRKMRNHVQGTGREFNELRARVGNTNVVFRRTKKQADRTSRSFRRLQRSTYDVGLDATRTGWRFHKLARGLFSAQFAGSALAAVMMSGLVVSLYATARAIAVVTKNFGSFEMAITKAAMRQDNFTVAQNNFRIAAIDASKASIFSAGEAAKGLEKLSAAAFGTQQAMAALPGVLSLATIADMDVADAADVATGILAGFRLQAEDLAMVNDVLAVTATKSKTSVGEIGTAMEYVGTVAGQFKLEVNEVAAALAMMAQANIEGEKAGTALRGALMKLANPSKEAAALLKQMNIEVWKTQDGEKRLKSLVEIVEQFENASVGAADTLKVFMQRAGPGMAAILAGGSDELKAFIEKLNESEGAAADMEDKMTDTFEGKFQIFKGVMETLTIVIGDFVGSALKPFIVGLTDVGAASLDSESDFMRFMIYIATGASDAFMMLGAVMEPVIVFLRSMSIQAYKMSLAFQTLSMGAEIAYYSLSTLVKTLDSATRLGFQAVTSILEIAPQTFEGLFKMAVRAIGQMTQSVLEKVQSVVGPLRFLAEQMGLPFAGALSAVESMMAGKIEGVKGKIAVLNKEISDLSYETDQINRENMAKLAEIVSDWDTTMAKDFAMFKGNMSDMADEFNQTMKNMATVDSVLAKVVPFLDEAGKKAAAGLMDAVKRAKSGMMAMEALEKQMGDRKPEKEYEVPDTGSGKKPKFKRPEEYWVWMRAAGRERDKQMAAMYRHQARMVDLEARAAFNDMSWSEKAYKLDQLDLKVAKDLSDIEKQRVKNRAMYMNQVADAMEKGYDRDLLKLQAERLKIGAAEMDATEKHLALKANEMKIEEALTARARERRKEYDAMVDSYVKSVQAGLSGMGEESGLLIDQAGVKATGANDQQLAALNRNMKFATGDDQKKFIQAQIDYIERENEQIQKNVELQKQRMQAIDRSTQALVEMGGALHKVGQFSADTEEGANAMVAAFGAANGVTRGFMDAVGVGAAKQAKVMAGFNAAMALFMTGMAIANPGMAGVYGLAAAKHTAAAVKFGAVAAVGGAGVGGSATAINMRPSVPDDEASREDLARKIGEELRKNDRQKMDKAVIMDLRNALILGEDPAGARNLLEVMRPELERLIGG